MKTVALGVSGGIDSTMTALILQEQGYKVIGLHMTKWDESSGIISQDKRGCFGPGEKDATSSARLACERLGIPFYSIDLRDEFEHEVLTYFRNEFMGGRTPNPCVICNRRIKFGRLITKARDMGLQFDYFATGHYAINEYNDRLQRWQLSQARDKSKDQSYFLGFLSQAQLSEIIFPLGAMLKSEIKAYAEARGYAYLVRRKESQDFLEAEDASPLFAKCKPEPGDFVDEQGKILGQHQGLPYYTIGQRRHLGLAGFPQPMHVLKIDSETNRIVLGTADRLMQASLIAASINWVSIPPTSQQLSCHAKIRNAHVPAACKAQLQEDGTMKVVFDTAQSAITPGQLLALYDGNLLLAAGIILTA
ncbi:MAG: tRNA 2-thiouridine(34) synthase MnmA [Candidatus Cloacimonetes bacterium]|nr:tRNA 2-thiouridine(34) synthase MnmA [Candidatus Cloacimonadota bacterium]